jgi:hypothetical protein
MTLQVVQHFNDLLMRLRSFGLPLLVTVGAAGFALSLNRHIEDVPKWANAALLTTNAVVVPLLLVLLFRRPGWGLPPPSADAYDTNGKLEPWETVMWFTPTVFALAAAGAYWGLDLAHRVDLTKQEDCCAGVPVLAFGLTVLVVLYALDRFYYYKLLLGAVNRASLTEPGQSATIVTLLYFLPGITAYSIMLAFLVLNPTIT